MPYFDGCYFDIAYFDASPCVPPPVATLGRHVRGRHPIIETPLEPEDDMALIVLLL